jgi:hypothetical protein
MSITNSNLKAPYCNAADLVFDLKQIKHDDHPAYYLGSAVCNLEAAAVKIAITRDDYELIAAAFAGATTETLMSSAYHLYVDDVGLGFGAVLRLLKQWLQAKEDPFKGGLRRDIRVFRNALHNIDLRDQRKSDELANQCLKVTRIFDETLAPFQFLYSSLNETSTN